MSNNPTSKKLNLLQLLSNKEALYENEVWQPLSKIEIPIIQRDYAQGREGKEELRENFLKFLLEVINGTPKELDFVYGSVRNKIFQPLDGQQRLTTLFLLHWYVAVKENKLNDNVKNILTKFTYETRISSREFCFHLVNKGIDFNKILETDYYDEQKNKPKNNDLSKTIIDSSWFFLSWKRDPTIKSMLTMLDSIQQIFKDTKEVWDKLNNISFHYIELQNFGLSDDLYIKMNARGKPLTDFENFKAKFEQHINKECWEKSTITTDTFAHKIDTIWTDFFWNYRDKTENVFDEQLLNFFRTMAIFNYALKANNKDENFKENIVRLREKDNEISFKKYIELGCIDEDYFKTVKSVLSKISDTYGLKRYHLDETYINENEIFNGTIQNNLSIPDLIVAFAFYKYIALEKNINTEHLSSWLRIVHNLVEGSRPYFNDEIDLSNALVSINGLLEHRNSILKYLSNDKFQLLSGFTKEQVTEEIQKAKLISQSDEWENAILAIEKHGYFKGQIGFLLDWCRDENEKFDIDKFKEYTKKSKALFGQEGLKEFDSYLFERALLATGDYLLSIGRNYCFLISKGHKERDISWKRLLRGDGDKADKREIIKELITEISVENLKDDLENIIENFSSKSDWRYHFIKQPEMIAACGNLRLIRRVVDCEILLLSSTATHGYHREYYSYSLYSELKETYSLEVEYYPQKSREEYKYFELNNKQIFFDYKIGKYCWTINYLWDNRKEFESREDAISNLISY